jgi:DNA-binding NtrC family response regulator
MQVIVVDDAPDTCAFLRAVFSAEGHACETFYRAEDADKHLEDHQADLLLVDVYLGATNGIDLVRRVRAAQPSSYAVVMTAHVSLETAAQSITDGAIEYVSKPLTIDQIRAIASRAKEFHAHAVQATLPPAEDHPKSSIIGRSPKMLEVYNAIGRVAPSSANVLITGASGTGKELVARAIHRHSGRALLPFTAVNCGSIAETILESELFGHEKGAFTGAERVRQGLIEATNGGTLFLDEITETSLAFQVKLLRVLQEQQVRRVGSNEIISVDVRVLAASNRDVAELIQKGAFREDLYYRLSVVQIAVPSLDERREDIPLLVSGFLQDFNTAESRQVSIESAAVKALQEMEWPGNVRELENTIKRLAIFARTGRITRADLDALQTGRLQPTAKEDDVEGIPAGSDRLLEIERKHITRVLSECDGNKAEAARRLGIERKTLYKKATRLGIDLHLTKQR